MYKHLGTFNLREGLRLPCAEFYHEENRKSKKKLDNDFLAVTWADDITKVEANLSEARAKANWIKQRKLIKRNMFQYLIRSGLRI